jgi:hypothetical protein
MRRLAMGKKSRNKSKKNHNEKESRNARQSDKKFIAAVVILVAIGVGLVAYNVIDKGEGPQSIADASQADVEKLKGGETKPVLSSTRFVGKTAAAYRVASKKPDLLDHMYCYCYCSRSIGHKSLLSCFTDNHAANCGICQDQAFYANSLDNQGYDIAQVRKAVDKKFWKPLR